MFPMMMRGKKWHHSDRRDDTIMMIGIKWHHSEEILVTVKTVETRNWPIIECHKSNKISSLTFRRLKR